MTRNLDFFQDDAVNCIYNFYFSKSNKGKIFLASGMGKSGIISSAIEKILKQENCKILLLCSFNSTVNDIKEKLKWGIGESYVYDYLPDLDVNGVFVSTYNDILLTNVSINYEQFNLIICMDADKLNGELVYPFLINTKKRKRLLIFSSIIEKKEYMDYECIFKFTVIDALEKGYIINKVDYNFIVSSVYLLLKKLDYKNIEITPIINGNKYIRPDLIAQKGNNSYVFEVKFYRDLSISNTLIENAVNSMRKYQSELSGSDYSFILVMLCLVDKDYKKEIYEKYKIIIWDISNILYLANEYEDIYNLLVRAIPSFSSNIKKEKPFGFESDFNEIDVCKKNKYEEFKFRLDKCPFGNDYNVSREYEEICTEMIKYLFETEFFQMSPQHYTYDKAFKFDLICSLKGTTSFWKFLIEFYKTKFVVFEYKNYAELIKQNSIFVTEKYLLSSALRNVAFIISRKGFDRNAIMMALGCLKNDNKLIIDLSDEDMLSMIKLKEDGEEASDYLMNKVENILMSISK